MASQPFQDLESAIGKAVVRAAEHDGLLVCGPDGTIAVCNAAGARFLDTLCARAIGERLPALLEPLDGITALRFQSALAADLPAEFVVATPLGDDCWTEVRVLPIEGGVAFLLNDVTDRERSERRLRRKEARLLAANDSLRLAHKAAHAASWEWRAGHGLRWLDVGAARQLIGLPPTWTEHEVLADWRELVVETDRLAAEEGIATIRNLGEASFEFQVLGADGRHHWLRGSGAVVERDADGAPVRISGVTLDVSQAKAAEQALKREIAQRVRVEQHQKLLLHELRHRVKNILATVQAIARQTFRRRGADERIVEFEDRLMALARTHDVLTEENWVSAPLGEILQRTLSPHQDPKRRRIQLEGPEVQVPPRLALALAMAVHELATNAVKYGALSNDEGVVRLRWRLDRESGQPRLLLEWREAGGPPVEPPSTRGFGSRLIEQGLSRDIGGAVRLRFERSGVRCLIDAELENEPVEPLDLPARAGGAEALPKPTHFS